MKILVTGGAGFIGTHLVQRLCRKHNLVIFDNLHRDSLKDIPELNKHPRIKFILGDILNINLISKALKDSDLVIHLAAIAGVSSYYKLPIETLKVNMIGTWNLLEHCKNSRIKKLVYFSSSEVYGLDAFKVDEKANHCIGPLHDFRWTYAISKLAAEQLVFHYGRKYGFKTYIIRPFNIYGPRQTGEGAISNFLRAIINKQPIVVYGNGKAVRSWCYVSDCVDAVETLIEKTNINNEIFNIGNHDEIFTTLELAKLVRQIFDYDISIIFRKVQRTEIKSRVPNINKAKKILHYWPKVSLIEGLRLAYDYYQNYTKR